MDNKMKESYRGLLKDLAVIPLLLFLAVCSVPFAIIGFLFSFACEGINEGIDLYDKLKLFMERD